MTKRDNLLGLGLDKATLAAIRSLEQAWIATKHLPDVKYLPDTKIDTKVFDTLAYLPEIEVPYEVSRIFADWPFIDDIFSQVGQFVHGFGSALGADMARLVKLPSVGIPRVELPDIGDLFWRLPSVWELGVLPDEIREVFADADAGGTILEEAEYGFADHLWNVAFLAAFAHVDHRVRDAVVTNRLAAVTRSEEFANDLRAEMEGSTLLRRRWPIVDAALEAHRKKVYALSIPAFLPQIEGAVVDAMFLKDLVIKENRKFYLRGEDGEPKKNRKGNKLPPVTLQKAVDSANLGDDEDLASASDFLASALVKRRNDVLHGRDVAYGKAKLSVQALLVLLVMARGVRDLEYA